MDYATIDADSLFAVCRIAPVGSLDLDRDMPHAAPVVHSGVLDLACKGLRATVLDPTQSLKTNLTPFAVELPCLDMLRHTKGLVCPLALEARIGGKPFKEALVGDFDVLERLLEDLHWNLGKPRRNTSVIP